MRAQRRSHRTLLLALLAGLAVTAPGLAQSSVGTPGPAPAQTAEQAHLSKCAQPNALSAVSCELAAALPSKLGRLLVAATVSRDSAVFLAASSGKQSLGSPLEALAARVATLTAGRLGTQSLGVSDSLSGARVKGQHAQHLLWLEVKVTASHLEVTADVYPLPVGFWERITAPAAFVIAHGFASRPIDSEVGSFLPKIPLVLSRIDKARAPSSILAIACGDLNGDTSLEIAIATRHDIQVGRIQGGVFIPHETRPWSELSEVAPTPLQQPIATLDLAAGWLEAGSTDRAQWVRLDPSLELLGQRDGLLPWPGRGCVRRGGLGLTADLVGCQDQRSLIRLPVSAELDAVAGSRFVTPTGRFHEVVGGRPLGATHLELLDTDGRRARIEDVGAQISLADLNRDGVLEIASSRATLDPSLDVLSIHTWPLGDVPVAAFTVPAPGGIRALGNCPAEDTGLSPLVVAVGEELWVVR